MKRRYIAILLAAPLLLAAAAKITNSNIASNAAIALSKLAAINNNTFVGNTSGGSAVPSAQSVASVKTALAIACSDLTDEAASCATDATNATNITSGTLPSAQLPAPAASAIAALDIDWSLRLKTGGFYTKTLAANTTLTFSNVDDGCINIRLTNTASNYTVTWPAMEWPEDTAPTQTVGAKSDVYVICNDGTNTFGSVVQDYHF